MIRHKKAEFPCCAVQRNAAHTDPRGAGHRDPKKTSQNPHAIESTKIAAANRGVSSAHLLNTKGLAVARRATRPMTDSRKGDVSIMKRVTVLAAILAFGSTGLVLAQENARSQERLQREVRHELVMLPYYGVFDNLEFKVEGDSVTLLGQVTRPALKSDAGTVVKKIEGVARVENQIEVLPLSPNDDRIRRAAYNAIYRQTSLSRYALQAIPPIHIIVANGKIQLEGVVATEADKRLAGIRANGVSGAFAVTNNLRVEKP
jgi:hyperosmotically inducible protein